MNKSKIKIDYLYALRNKKSMSQEQLAELLSVSVRTVQRIEKDLQCSSALYEKIKGVFDLYDIEPGDSSLSDTNINRVNNEISHAYPDFIINYYKHLVFYKDYGFSFLFLSGIVFGTIYNDPVFGFGLILPYPLINIFFQKQLALGYSFMAHKKAMLMYYELPTLYQSKTLIFDAHLYMGINLTPVIQKCFFYELSLESISVKKDKLPSYFTFTSPLGKPLNFVEYTQVLKSKDDKYFFCKDHGVLSEIHEGYSFDAISESELKVLLANDKVAYESVFGLVKAI